MGGWFCAIPGGVPAAVVGGVPGAGAGTVPGAGAGGVWDNRRAARSGSMSQGLCTGPRPRKPELAPLLCRPHLAARRDAGAGGSLGHVPTAARTRRPTPSDTSRRSATLRPHGRRRGAKVGPYPVPPRGSGRTRCYRSGHGLRRARQLRPSSAPLRRPGIEVRHGPDRETVGAAAGRALKRRRPTAGP